MAGGFLGGRYLGQPEPTTDLQSLENRSLTKYRLMIDESGGWDAYQDTLHTMDRIARAHGIGIGEVAIAYTLTRPGVGAAIVGAHNANHLDHLTRLGTQGVGTIDLTELEHLLKTRPGPSGDIYDLERNSTSHKGVMKYNLNKGRDTNDAPRPI